ncbi:MAG: S-methyl-5'-thioinosine phosphorylase [Gammaproteobacteria bacterium]|nr:S-methyl-5'-thioinosine phosphorylase [Gammaproteobacteria bacterium]
MKRIAIIGGTGSQVLLKGRRPTALPLTEGRWGRASAELLRWEQGALEVVFLARHGGNGGIAPHRVNYRANIDALREVAPQAVIAVNAVGGITSAARPGRIVLPDQLIDYTWGRDHTFFDGEAAPLRHVEFDPPFGPVRQQLAAAASSAGVDVLTRGTYGCTQGPRLETAAEIDRLALDGCDVVGMTGMPEAALAREAGLDYAICALVVNPAAGRLSGNGSIHAEISRHLDIAGAGLQRLLGAFCSEF